MGNGIEEMVEETGCQPRIEELFVEWRNNRLDNQVRLGKTDDGVVDD